MPGMAMLVNSSVAMFRWVLLGGLLLLGAGVARGDWPQPPENIQEHVISLKAESPTEKAAREHLAAALAGVKPAAEAVPRISATADKGYLVWGDLFRTGGCYALYEPKEKVAEDAATLGLAEWKDGKWELRGLWKMQVDWVPQEERWSGSGYQDTYKDAARVPFELEDVISDEVPEVIVSGEKMKYHQAKYLLHFDAKTHGLELLTYSMARPVKAGKQVRLYDASGNKAIWQEWQFLEWKDGKLVERAAWHSETPYNGEEASFDTVRVAGEDGKVENFRINLGVGEGENTRNYEVMKDGGPFAKVAVTWTPGKSQDNAELMERAWFFEKLTGLAREDFPERYGPETGDKPKLQRLENGATVRMVSGSGNEEARERFSGKK